MNKIFFNVQVGIISNYLVIIYVIFSIFFLINWLRFQKRYPSLYPEEKFLALVIIIIISVLWPVALPFYWIKLFRNK